MAKMSPEVAQRVMEEARRWDLVRKDGSPVASRITSKTGHPILHAWLSEKGYRLQTAGQHNYKKPGTEDRRFKITSRSLKHQKRVAGQWKNDAESMTIKQAAITLIKRAAEATR